jgi:hypothetical protein
MLWAKSEMDPYIPAKPTPAGPSSNAIAFPRMILTTMFTAEDPPTTAVDARIWRYTLDCVGWVVDEDRAGETAEDIRD